MKESLEKSQAWEVSFTLSSAGNSLHNWHEVVFSSLTNINEDWLVPKTSLHWSYRNIPNKWGSISSISFLYLFIAKSVEKENTFPIWVLKFIEHVFCSVLHAGLLNVFSQLFFTKYLQSILQIIADIYWVATLPHLGLLYVYIN